MSQPKPKPKKMGRPKLPKGEAKARTIQVRLNGEAIKRVNAAAKASGQTVSEWVRNVVNAAA